MYGIFTYIWLILRVNVGKYSIHGAYGIYYKLLSGWWYTYYPSEKTWSSSLGMLTFPIYGKIKKCSKPPNRYNLWWFTVQYMAQCYGFSLFIINCYGLPEHHGTTNCRLVVGLAEPWSLLSDQVIGRLDVDLFCKSKIVINTCSMLLHKVFINTRSINLLYFWPKCIWLVVYLPLWKIWVRHLGLSFPIYGKP